VSFPRYPKYKDSGVEWIGQVPEHWTVTSLARITNDRCDGPFGSGLKSDHYVDAGVRVIRLQNIRRYGFDDGDEAFIDETYFREQLSGHEVRAGDVLIAGLGDERNTVGRACVAPDGIGPAMVKADCFRFRLNLRKALPQFVALQLTAGSVADAGALSSGSTRARIPLSDMASRKLALPPLSEQPWIVDFTVRALGKMNELMTEQQRLMGLLKEKRQAVISHAVTKGLNPHVPMKPSGIEWLGEVPAHWTVTLMKRAFRAMDYGISDALDSQGAIAILRMGNIEDGHVVLDDLKFTDDVDPALLLQPGDLLYNRTNSLDLIGKVGLFPGVPDRQVSFASYLVRLRTEAESVPEYFAYLQNTEGILGLARSAAFVAIGQCNLNPSRYGQIEVAIPPKVEQAAIAAFLDREVAGIDALVAEAQKTVDLLQERRTALISAAVTGQIDVRELAVS